MTPDAARHSPDPLRADANHVIRCPKCGNESASWMISAPGPELPEDVTAEQITASVDAWVARMSYVCPNCEYELASGELRSVYSYRSSKSRLGRLFDRGMPFFGPDWWDRVIKGRKGITFNKLFVGGLGTLVVGGWIAGTWLFDPDSLADETFGSTGSGILGIIAVSMGTFFISRALPKVLRGEGGQRPRRPRS